MTSLSLRARPVNPCTEHDHVEGDDCPSAPFFTFGQAVRISARPLDAEGRDWASLRARQFHGRIGIVVNVERCDRELVPRMLYAIAIWPASQIRLYSCELERYDGDALPQSTCGHGFPADVTCSQCDALAVVEGEL